jgi:ribonuclease BN (tRNA processing enzyme)
MGMRVRFLGSGDAFGSGGRLQTCIHVEAGDAQFLLDCGASALIGMRRYGVDPNAICLVVLSHLHGDHFGGLPFVIMDAQLVSRRSDPLTVVGPPGTERRLLEAMDGMFPGSADASRRFELRILEYEVGRPNSFDEIVVTPHEVVHAAGAPACALRVACNGRVLAYSGDTEWTDALIPVARDADVFVAEAYFYEKRVKYHLDYATLRENRERLGARRTVITHMSAELLARLDEVDCAPAGDGQVIEV